MIRRIGKKENSISKQTQIRILERKINRLKKEAEDEDQKSAGLCPLARSKMRDFLLAEEENAPLFEADINDLNDSLEDTECPLRIVSQEIINDEYDDQKLDELKRKFDNEKIGDGTNWALCRIDFDGDKVICKYCPDPLNEWEELAADCVNKDREVIFVLKNIDNEAKCKR